MKHRQIFVTAKDLKKINELFMVEDSFDCRNRSDLKALKEELQNAKVVDSGEVPSDVVTMNTKLMYVDLDDDSKSEVTLVFPADADISSSRMSIFSPIGTALLGYKEGDIIEWDVPAGKARIKIEKILYQPEASGDLEL